MTRSGRLCRICGERVARPGWPRCTACHGWYYAHGYTERPPMRFRVAPGQNTGPCQHCGWTEGRFTRERCERCYAYWWRTGHDRPASVDAKGTLRPCQADGCTRQTTRPNRGYCARCYLRVLRAEVKAQRAAEAS